MWVKTTDGPDHCVVAIANWQKWVAGNAVTINGDVADEPLSGCQWSKKGPSGKKIGRAMEWTRDKR
jgi:hypothetical protein